MEVNNDDVIVIVKSFNLSQIYFRLVFKILCIIIQLKIIN